MKQYSHEIDENRDAFEIGIWENEGGAPDRDCVKADRPRTGYQIFTGVPPRSGRRNFIGLSRSDATDSMRAHLGNSGRRNKRLRLDPPTMDILEIGKIRT